MEDLRNSTLRFFSDQELCYADVLSPAQILLQEKRATPRELYYKLLCDSPDLFPSQTDVNRSIQDVVALLRGSRYSLGIIASSRGLIAGRLIFQHAIFQWLAEDRIFYQIPIIVITAKGYPYIATRFLLHQHSLAFPDLPILALVNWNPAGLAILCTFKFGSVTMGLEAYRYACNVKWLGLRADDLHLLPEQSLVPLKPKDWQIAKSLMSSEILQNYREELALAVQRCRRSEIEALHFHGYDFLGRYLAEKIVQPDYI